MFKSFKKLITFKSLTVIKIFFLSLVAIFVSNAFAANTAQQQLDNFITNVNSASGSFDQVKIDDSGQSIDEKQSGEFAFKRPGNFKWNITKPYEQLTLANSDNLIQYDPDLEQVIIRKADESIGSSPAAILFGQADLKKHFKLSDTETKIIQNHNDNNQNLNWIRTTPRTNDAGFEYIDIAFIDNSQDTPELRFILVKDGFGQTTKITFENIKTNPDLDEKDFSFEPPSGVDIVNM